MTELDPKESALYDETFDIEWELYSKLRTLVDASWDSNTVKLQVEELLNQYEKAKHELHIYQDKNDAEEK